MDPPKFPAPPTLAEIGIDKHLADRSRKLAALPAAQFESVMAEHREQQAAVTDSKRHLLGESAEQR